MPSPRMPRLTLQAKVFATLTALLVVLLLVFAGFSRIGLQHGLGPYVAEIELARMDWLAQRLVEEHRRSGNWNALRGQATRWRQLRQPGGEDGMPWRDDRPPPRRPGGPDGADFGADFGGGRPPPPPDGGGFDGPPGPPPDNVYRRLGLLDASGQPVVGATSTAPGQARMALRDGATAIGTLVLAPAGVQASAADQAFVRQHLGFVAWTGLAGLALALLLSWWLTRRWLAPVGALTEGAHALAQGQLSARVPVHGDDELARLAQSFNTMAQRLDQMDSSRRDWLADVAHELRTPLAAMRAEIEALQDGIRRFDDRTALRLHRQVMRLIHLVDDLRASLDAPRPGLRTSQVPTQPLALLAEALGTMHERFAQAGITVEAASLLVQAEAETQPTVAADPRQLHQVFMNLLENSLRYTDAGGRLALAHETLSEDGRAWLALHVDDSPPGVPTGEHARLFERLYRGEASRSRDHGGSGLGLAICRNLVLAQGGQITAGDSPLGGLRISLRLPLLQGGA